MAQTLRPIPDQNAEVSRTASAPSKDTMAGLLCLAAYLIVLVLSINHDSLWADEAFSAWVVSHRSYGDMLHTLFAGDSSDLQMLLYLLYLHAVVNLLGWSEWALRFANAPFAIIFGVSLYWTSTRVFGKRFAWIAPGLMPFAWVYIREARPYAMVLACATASTGCLLAYLFPTKTIFDRKLPLFCLGWLFVALCSHMLAVFVVPPMLLLVILSVSREQRGRFWRDWFPAIRVFLVPYLALGLYFVFTFLRGTGYAQSYPRPSISRFFYSIYEFTGLMAFGPNHLDMWNQSMSAAFRPYLPILLPGCLLFAASLALAIVSYRSLSSSAQVAVRALSLASLFGAIEIIGASVASGNQLSSRHWSAVVPLFLFLYLSMLNTRRIATFSLVLLALPWAGANIRLEALPQYFKEDYRGTAAATIAKSRDLQADIAWEPDALAGRYYGIDFRRNAFDCFPMPQTCAAGLSHVSWPVEAQGDSVVNWKLDEIQSWISRHAAAHKPVIVVLRTSRPYETADWRAALARQPHVTAEQRHGIEILTIPFDHPPADSSLENKTGGEVER